MVIPPGDRPPPHRHDFEESFIRLAGKIEATLRGEKSGGRAGNSRHPGYRRDRSAAGGSVRVSSRDAQVIEQGSSGLSQLDRW